MLPVLAALALAAAPSARASLRPPERTLLAAVNDLRAARGLGALRADRALTRAAESHSRRLLARDVLSHGAFASRLAGFGARGPAFGENLAWAVGPSLTSWTIVNAWLASPGHRANLLRPGWRRLGIGVAVGTFAGYRGATVFTADFAGS